MKFASLLWGRHRPAGSQATTPQIRSLEDLDGHFPWLDLGMECGSPARREIRNPLAVAIRALKVVEYSVATVSELNPSDRDASGMALLGLSGALHSLAEHGEWDSVGTLLYALETLVSPHDRQRWLSGLDPYIEPAGQM